MLVLISTQSKTSAVVDDDSDISIAGSDSDSDSEPEVKKQPLKKRRVTAPKKKTAVLSDDDSDGEGFDDGFDDEFYGDADDRSKLMAMPEIERESVLAERAEQRTVLRERQAMQRSQKAVKSREQEKKKAEGKKAAKSTLSRSRSSRQVRGPTAWTILQ